MKVLNQKIEEFYSLYHGDSCEVLKGLPDDSVHYTLFSPPFSSLYTYSNSDRDMGNSKNDDEFYKHFEFLVNELYRITMPGRLLSFHCINIPLMKQRDGVIGLKDFRGDLIKMFVNAGFIFHSEVCIWKNPVTEMQRTKALGLLHKQIKKDSSMSRQGIPDYVITMRKPGENPEPIEHTNESFPVDLWQKYASPVWMDIRQSDTLQKKSARAEEDERHICPLQLEVIKRCICLWTNPGDIVLDPFAGIASTNYMALRLDRRTIGVELKESYYQQAVLNCEMAMNEEIIDIFDEVEGDSKVYHPSHYNIPGKKECWDEMVERFGVEATKIFCKLNSFKYLYRHEEKNGHEDLEKAANYKNKFIELGGTVQNFEEGMEGYELSQYNTQ